MAERYENLDKALCKELEKLDKKYTADVEMSETDLSRAKDIRKALYYGEVYNAMKESGEWEDEESEEGYSGEGRSYRRGGRSYRNGGRGGSRGGGGGGSYAQRRSPYTGRFMSREMAEDYSGHYPMEYIDPYWDRRY